jgi:hypothetical protein
MAAGEAAGRGALGRQADLSGVQKASSMDLAAAASSCTEDTWDRSPRLFSARKSPRLLL